MAPSLEQWCTALEAGARSGRVPQAALRDAIDRLSEAAADELTPAHVAGWTGVDVAVLEELLRGAQPGAGAGASTPSTINEGTWAAAPPPVLRPTVPKRLGPYELLDELGHGGMGVVYRARHVHLGSTCAVKVLIAGEHASPEAIARFQREAASVARMGRHPNLISVHDLGQEGPVAYYAMDLVDGVSLRVRIQQGPIPLAEAARLVEKSARAVHFAHQHGVVHRDLKPENIVLRTDGEPLVMDFGLAREVGSSAQISVSGQLLGTPSYMAPEQARGEIHLTDARTDVYALGAVLYELLTGRSPHPGESAMERIVSVLQGEVASPRSVRADVSRDLETICMHCMERDPAARYPTAEALADDLARFHRGEPIHVRPPGRLSLAVRRVWRRKWLAAGIVAALAISAVAGASILRAREAAALEEWARPRVETALEDLERWDQHPYKRDVVLSAVRSEVEVVIRRLDEVLARHPACAPAWYARGKAWRRLRRLHEADVDLSHAIDLAPENAQYRLERARVTFEVILEVNLSDELAASLAEQLGGDWSERIRRVKADLEVARDAGRLRPWEAEACRAMVPLAGGDWEAAIPVLDRAIQAAPNEPDLYFLRGLANLGATRAEATRQENLPRIRRSYEDARKALDIKQSFYEAALLAGWGLFAVSQEEKDLGMSERYRLLEEGFVLMRRGTAIDPERQIGFYLLGHAWFWSWRNGKTPHGEAESLENAAVAWEEAARLAPWNEYAATWGLHARAKLATARPDEEAIPQLQGLVGRFAKWSWRHDWAYRSYMEAWSCWQLAQRLARTGEDASATWARAQEQAESAVRFNVNEGLYPEMIEGLARIAAERGATPSEASARVCQEYAARALTAKADDARSLAFSGLARLWLGDKAGARADLEEAISRDPTLEPLLAPWLARSR